MSATLKMWPAALSIPIVLVAVLFLTNAATIPLFTDTGNLTAGCKADGGRIAIAIDSSGSICGESFTGIKHFTNYFITNILNSTRDVNISVINFSNEADLVETFSKESNAAYVSHVLSRLSQKGQGTNTHTALELMMKNSFHNFSASNTPQIAIIVTDGSSHNPQLTREYAEKLKALGVEIYAIGVGNDVNVAELKDISSDPDFEYVYMIDDLNNVPLSMEALTSLTNLICTGTQLITTTDVYTSSILVSSNSGPATPIGQITHSHTATSDYRSSPSASVETSFSEFIYRSTSSSYLLSSMQLTDSNTQTVSLVQPGSVRSTEKPYLLSSVWSFPFETRTSETITEHLLHPSQFSQTLSIEHHSSYFEVSPTFHYISSALLSLSQTESRSIDRVPTPWPQTEPSKISSEIRSSISEPKMSSDMNINSSIPYLPFTTFSPTQPFYSSQYGYASSYSKDSLAQTDQMSYESLPSHPHHQMYQSSHTDLISVSSIYLSSSQMENFVVASTYTKVHTTETQPISVSSIYLSSSQKENFVVASTYTKVHTTETQPISVSHIQELSSSIDTMLHFMSVFPTSKEIIPTMLHFTSVFPTSKEIIFTNPFVQHTSVVPIEPSQTTSALTSSIISTFIATTSTAPTTTEQPTTTVSTTKTTPPTTSASCIAKIADVVFVIDSSGSIGAENFQKLKEFMKNIVRTFDIDSRYTRVAVIKYSNYPNIEFKLNNHTTLNELLAAIDGINYTIGGTNTADALQLMRLEGFDRERPAAPNIGIVITDGLSKYPTLTKAQAELAKNAGITLFAIGIGNETEEEELRNIASGERVYQVDGFDALETINSAVAHTTCGVNLDESFITRTTTSPRTTPSGCADYAENCGSYGRDSCYDYEPWARGHCPKSCGFCRDANTTTTKLCADAIKDCAQYGVEMCYKESQHGWVETNCPKFCGFCGDKHAPLPTTPATTIATTTEALCNDSILNCDAYGGPGMCQSFGQWAHQNCAKYCGFCFNYVHVKASTVGNKKCPAWKLPEACTFEHIHGQCCPSPKCPDGFILTVHRH